MRHYIEDNYYYIVDEEGWVLLKIRLLPEVDGNQVVIETENEIFAGPIELISFDPNPKN